MCIGGIVYLGGGNAALRMQHLLRKSLMIVLMLGTAAMSSAAVTCTVECRHESDMSAAVVRTDGCCASQQVPQPDESRDEGSNDHGSCLSLHCRTAMLSVSAPVTTDLVALVPAHHVLSMNICDLLVHERIFHPPRA